VAADVDHQSTPTEARLVLDRNCWHGEAIGGNRHQLEECLKPVHDAQRRRRTELRARVADFEVVGFIFAKLLHSLACMLAANDKSGFGRVSHFHVQWQHASLPPQIVQESINRTPQ